MVSRGSLAVLLIFALSVAEEAEARRRLFGRDRPFLRFFGGPVLRGSQGCGRSFCQNHNQFFRNQNNFANRIDARDVEQIQGFPNLVKNGNAIVERTLTPEGLVRFRELTILRDGRLFGAADPAETIRNLREFYLQNLDQFGIDLDDVCFGFGNTSRGRSRNGSKKISREADLVTRFLRANGGCNALNDTITVDLGTHGLTYEGVSDPGLSTEVTAGRRILNMILNSVANSSEILRIDRASVRTDGTVTLPNLSRFLRSDAIAMAFRDNPYTKCGQPIPLQWLAERLMNDEIYVRLLGIPQKLGDLGKRLGVFTDKTETQGNKTLVYTPPNSDIKESQPAEARERWLERQPQQGDVSGKLDNIRLGRPPSGGLPGGFFYTSWDFIDDPAPGLNEEARTAFGTGRGVPTHDASEMLWEMPNGFMAGALYNAAGQRQKNAPINIAKGGKLETISPMVACLQCHVDGINGGGFIKGSNPARRYTDVFAPGSPHPKVNPNLRNFFFPDGNTGYRREADRDSQRFVRVQELAEARVVVNGVTQPIVTDIIAKRREVLTEADQARELRLPPGSRAGSGKVSRAQFDQAFCTLKGGVRSSSDAQRLFINENATRDANGRVHDPSRR